MRYIDCADLCVCNCLHLSNDLFDGKFGDDGHPSTKSGQLISSSCSALKIVCSFNSVEFNYFLVSAQDTLKN